MADKRLSGKLAVILHADVVGSTMLVQQDEQKAHQRIQDSFQRFGKTISNYHGQVRELRGDALLAEFERASDAISAALSFQSDQANYNAQLDDDIRPLVRVGIAMGEVVIADDTITGAGVVLAQRLEQLADPGGLCITPAIREAMPRRLPFELENIGEQQLKGFDEPIGVYRVVLTPGAAVPSPEPGRNSDAAVGSQKLRIVATAVVLAVFAAATYGFVTWQSREPVIPESTDQISSEKPSIAVLPFDNMSGDPEQEYFADGITEDLTTDLSRISGLFVVARNSAFSYKGRSVDVRTVAQELGVRYVLEGSIRRADNQIRINAQLVDGSNGGHIWAERFDGTMADVFALQDQVNRKIVAALEVNLTSADEKRFDHVETKVPEAYDRLLLGIEQYNTFTPDAVVEAREIFKQAAALDPNYARAYANIALTHATEVNFFWSKDREGSIRLGLEFARKALELDDTIPQIYLTRSILYLSQRQHQTALESAQRTIEVHPNYVDGYATLAFISSYSGNFEKGLEALDQAIRINPQGTGVYLAVKGRILFLMEKYDDAVPALEEALDRNPGFDRIHLHLAAVYAQLGRIEDAEWSVEEALAINPDITLAKERRESIYRRESDLEHYVDALRKAGVPE
ncbi:MAG: adenylate/guanylate cyclase domain-containing protein [Gammaproteobacteria bacterium]|nr:adenylate/guanylate cyclase domain-containing protein [Gammaproteobacteria bacterium]MDH3856512.1 adenylate/guanylate cyclase domain-containing protein [Gammaproteobacteria bacterium]